MKILITAPYNEQGRKQLAEQFDEVIYRCWKDHGQAYGEQQLIELLQATEADGLIVELDHVTGRVLDEVPSLQFIGVCRGTPSNVDVQLATERGIPVFYTPARNAQAVAEMVVGSLITLLRNVIPSSQWLEAGEWKSGRLTAYLAFKGNELAGKKVGMVGFGAVAQRTAGILRSFPCDIQYYDPYVTSTDPRDRKLSLEQLFADSDIVSVHLPVTAETTDLIDERLLCSMKPDSIFVNTARSAVVQQHALVQLLEQGRIRGAIIDVFEQEPPLPQDYELIRLPNVLAIPHLAGASYEVEDHHVTIMNQALQQWFGEHDHTVRTLYNKAILEVQTDDTTSISRL
ncbi:2-hydroxyacid dehydrogenase [Paenibacillus campi]|uniref:2-hydroxyacid dehydrogenase n=1 Tax=Paenibacillus campi TaxID=3106031 RepID=UPI002AFFFFBD|nr:MULTISPECIES: 2-hydroxyacid dehydrogenase [unclassified Paenibacillus]